MKNTSPASTVPPANTHVVALLSGGLDSILAVMLMQRQGIRVTCLHFVTPFFNKAEKIPQLQEWYGFDILQVDIGQDFVRMLKARPEHGFGKMLNPCVDCKILMLTHARRIMQELGACAIISGEVLGQRPMSQRADSLNVIQNAAGVKGLLLRPLCAQHLVPTLAEEQGLVDRNGLLGISGRGRKDQLALAKEFGLREIPTPAGACSLGEREKARNYWKILTLLPDARPEDFVLAETGRQFWLEGMQGVTPSPDGAAPLQQAPSPLPWGHGGWLAVGRNQQDNEALESLAREDDFLLKLRDFPGPLALVRPLGAPLPPEALARAAALAASYSPKAALWARENGSAVIMNAHKELLTAPGHEIPVQPSRSDSPWQEADWERARNALRQEARERAAALSEARLLRGV